jgi:hypothetical protein
MVLRAKVLPQRANSHHGALVGDHRTRHPPQPFPFSLNQFKMGSPSANLKFQPCISDPSTDLDSHPVNVIIIRLSLCTMPYTSSTSANLTLASLLRVLHLARFRSQRFFAVLFCCGSSPPNIYLSLFVLIVVPRLQIVYMTFGP